MEKQSKVLKYTIQITTILFTILLIGFIIYAIHTGFSTSSKETMVLKVKEYGWIAPIIFILIQQIQVVFPVIPGGASCLVGVLAFGPVWGFIYNYIGLSIGSLISFFISRKFGLPIIRKLFKEKTVNKYLDYIKQNKFDKIFFLGILLPGAPDDLLCYIAGLTKMKAKTFSAIILLGKPLTLILYSLSIYLVPILH